jgi:hypothetical protein
MVFIVSFAFASSLNLERYIGLITGVPELICLNTYVLVYAINEYLIRSTTRYT